MDEACRQPTAPRLEDAALAFGKAGKFELGQGVELALEEVETGFDLARGGTEGRGVGGDGIAGAARVAQERFASRRVGDAPGGEERLGLARAQGVRLDGVGEAALVGGAEGAEGNRGARGQASGVEALEAVRDGRDADRERGERGAGVGARAAQGGVRGAQRADGKFADEAHGRGSSTGRS